MKKNKIILTLFIGLILLPLSFVMAAELTPVTETAKTNNVNSNAAQKLKVGLNKKTETIKQDFESKKIEMGKKISAKKDIKKKKLDAKAQEKVRVTLEKIYNKLNDQINKLAQAGIKISIQIYGFENDRRDVTDAKAQYNVAKIALEKATSDVLASRIVALGQVTTETSNETFRDLVKTAEESIKTASGEYRKVLPLLANLEKLSGVVKKIPATTSN